MTSSRITTAAMIAVSFQFLNISALLAFVASKLKIFDRSDIIAACSPRSCVDSMLASSLEMLSLISRLPTSTWACTAATLLVVPNGVVSVETCERLG